ncbi:MAG TPA: glutamine--fructose-6-phosphate transaminase (isomerizing), partial [Flavobacteriales bacterium]|nr:glutamine--fructose-6-phosphate transaminase (isomerizing) [Flavobacteriales bacterium]
MCGIVGYLGEKPAYPILIDGLKRLEYRGYDSAGIATLEPDGALRVEKRQGKVANLTGHVGDHEPQGTVGIGHTRWATHGPPNDVNAHPHLGGNGQIAVIHNGIIENYQSLRTWLMEKGHEFDSETDTEVLVHLIGELYRGDLEKAVQAALKEVEGAYAIAVICRKEPGVMVVARKGSPLMVGVGKDEYIVASDQSAIVSHTNQAFTLDDYTVAKLTADTFRTSTIDDVEITPEIRELEVEIEQIELGGFDHYMLKEIHEQPRALRLCLKGRIDERAGQIKLGGVQEHGRELARAKKVVFVGQGTALHAAMIGEYLMEDLAKIPTEVEFASEFRYRNPIVEEGTVVIAISQSGETADTLAALEEARRKGATGIGVVNVVGSSISRETDAGVYLRVGPEIGVASTKAFVGQVMVSAMLATFAGRRRYLSQEHLDTILGEMNAIPGKIEQVLEAGDHIREATARFIDRENWLFLGRGVNYPVAMEGALKLKEISYIHA